MSEPTAPVYQYSLGGSLRVEDPTYVTRQADEDFYAGLKAGEFCYVLNSRQMGKSSLRVRAMARLKSEGIACAAIDITSIVGDDTNEEKWYAGRSVESLKPASAGRLCVCGYSNRAELGGSSRLR